MSPPSLYDLFMSKNNTLGYMNYWMNDPKAEGWEYKQAKICMKMMKKNRSFKIRIEEECDSYWNDYYQFHEVYSSNDIYRNMLTGNEYKRNLHRIAYWISNEAYKRCRDGETSDDSLSTDEETP